VREKETDCILGEFLEKYGGKEGLSALTSEVGCGGAILLETNGKGSTPGNLVNLFTWRGRAVVLSAGKSQDSRVKGRKDWGAYLRVRETGGTRKLGYN